MDAIVNGKVLSYDGTFFNCVIGREGITQNKKEGDWKTPAGIFNIEKIYYRKDRIPELATDFEMIPITKEMGWCDDVSSPFYNQPITIPSTFKHEDMWRDDELYDIVAVLNYNTNPIFPGKGSAIFIHVSRPNMEYTEGCIALAKEDLLLFLTKISRNTAINIQP